MRAWLMVVEKTGKCLRFAEIQDDLNGGLPSAKAERCVLCVAL